jgi:hypothetical protein
MLRCYEENLARERGKRDENRRKCDSPLPADRCSARDEELENSWSASRNAHQLRALKPARAQTYVPQRAPGALWPRGGRRPFRPVGCMRGLGRAQNGVRAVTSRRT